MKRLLLICLLGCGVAPGNQYDVQIDSSFTDSETQIIFRALDLWQATSQNLITFNPIVISNPCTSNTNHTICIHNSNVAALSNDDCIDHAIGCTNYDPGTDSAQILIATSVVDNDHDLMLQDVQHELGHAMGLIHTGHGTVMCANNDCAALTVQCADVQQYQAFRQEFQMNCSVETN